MTFPIVLNKETVQLIIFDSERYENSTEIQVPQTCPSCGQALTQKGPLLFCTNHSGCKEQIVDRISHFASRDAMNIEGFSEKTAGSIYDNLSVRNLSDIYKISEEELLTLEKYKEKKAQNVINSIQKSKNPELYRFI